MALASGVPVILKTGTCEDQQPAQRLAPERWLMPKPLLAKNWATSMLGN